MKHIINIIRYYLGIRPGWKDCSKASCWQGANAGTRHMNNLSPRMPFGEFKDRTKWAEKRGCNCLHLFLVNKADGERAGYRVTDEATAKEADRRIRWAAKRGLGIVLWCIADDSNDWAKALDMNALMNVCKKHGWLDIASTIVVGLECDEYWSEATVARNIAAIRKVYKGKVGIHTRSGKWAFCAGHADIVFAQTDPGKSAAAIAQEVKRALGTGKPVNFFELDRHENRDLAQAALNAGAFGVGNW